MFTDLHCTTLSEFHVCHCGHLLFKDRGQSPPQLPFLQRIQGFGEGNRFQDKEQQRGTAGRVQPGRCKTHTVLACVFGCTRHKSAPTTWTWVTAASSSFWCLLAFAHATAGRNKGRGARRRAPRASRDGSSVGMFSRKTSAAAPDPWNLN